MRDDENVLVVVSPNVACRVSKRTRSKIVAYADFIDVNKAQAKVIEAWNQRTGEVE